jgi:hypothetical protein
MDEQLRIALACAKEQRQKSAHNRKEVRKNNRQQDEFKLIKQYQSSSFKKSSHETEEEHQQQAPTSTLITDEENHGSNHEAHDDASCIGNDLTESDNTSEYYLLDAHNDFNFDMICDHYYITNTQSTLSVQTTRLHHFTNISTNDYCRNLGRFLRDAKICKSQSNQLISIIKSVLPQPNYMPSSTAELYRLMNVDDLFTRRKVCITCQLELPLNEHICQQCRSTDQKTTATVFDVDLHKVLPLLLQRLSKNIEEYKKKALQNDNSEQLNDIIFNRLYAQLVNKL